MTQSSHPAPLPRKPRQQKAVLRLVAGRAIDARVELRLTNGGLLAIGGLVSSILLSTAVLVGVTTRHQQG